MNGWRSSLSLSHTQKKVTEWWLEMHAYASLRTDVISIIVNDYYLSINSVGQDNALERKSMGTSSANPLPTKFVSYKCQGRSTLQHTRTHTHTEELVKEQIKLPSHASTRYTHKQIPTNVLATDELGELILIGASREEKREARNSTYVVPLRTYVLHTLFDHHAPTHQICPLCSPVKEKSGIN
jgi:hypothetical protein